MNKRFKIRAFSKKQLKTKQSRANPKIVFNVIEINSRILELEAQHPVNTTLIAELHMIASKHCIKSTFSNPSFNVAIEKKRAQKLFEKTNFFFHQYANS